RLRLRQGRGPRRQGGPARCAGGPDRGRGVPGQFRLGAPRTGGRAGRAHGGGRVRGGRAERRTHAGHGAALGGHRRPRGRPPVVGGGAPGRVLAAASGELRLRPRIARAHGRDGDPRGDGDVPGLLTATAGQRGAGGGRAERRTRAGHGAALRGHRRPRGRPPVVGGGAPGRVLAAASGELRLRPRIARAHGRDGDPRGDGDVPGLLTATAGQRGAGVD